MEPYTTECCTSEIIKVSDIEAQYEQRKRKLSEILNSDDTAIDENKFRYIINLLLLLLV